MCSHTRPAGRVARVNEISSFLHSGFVSGYEIAGLRLNGSRSRFWLTCVPLRDRSDRPWNSGDIRLPEIEPVHRNRHLARA